MIQAVLFDYDGVLVNSMPSHVRAWQHVFKGYGFDVEPEEVLLAEGSPAPDLAREICSRRNLSLTGEEIRNLVVKKQTFYRQVTTARVQDGAEALLSALLEAGKQLALVTGSERENIEQTLPKKFTQLFDAIVTGDDVQNGKPAPEPYLKAAEKIGLKPAKCLVIENAPYGIEAARRAGMAVVALTTTLKRHQIPGANWYADDLQDLRSRLDEIIRNNKEAISTYEN